MQKIYEDLEFFSFGIYVKWPFMAINIFVYTIDGERV
jgi:hypothetical protein